MRTASKETDRAGDRAYTCSTFLMLDLSLDSLEVGGNAMMTILATILFYSQAGDHTCESLRRGGSAASAGEDAWM